MTKKATFKKEHEIYEGYLDDKLIDYNKSYQVSSRPNTVGCRLVYQYIVMLDDTIYQLISQSTSTNGIFRTFLKEEGLTQKQVKALSGEALLY